MTAEDKNVSNTPEPDGAVAEPPRNSPDHHLTGLGRVESAAPIKGIAPAGDSAQHSAVAYRRQIVLTVVDKGMLGLGIALATVLFGARLEAVKRADAQTLEITKVRITEATAYYQGTIALLVEHNAYISDMEDRFRLGASRTDLLKTRAAYQSQMKRLRASRADLLWVEQPLWHALNEFSTAVGAYTNVNGHLRINCVLDQMSSSPMAGGQLTRLWDECVATCGKKADNGTMTGMIAGGMVQLSAAVQTYAQQTTRRPSIWSD